jgi:hypothetical protein
VVPNSDSVAFNSAGTFYWAAFYSGDANNNKASSDCSTELLVVNPVTPGITTTAVSGPVTLGATIHDTAHLTGLVNPNGSGTITFTLYSDPQCDTTPVFTSGSTPLGVTANGDYVSGDFTTVAAGSYYWIASYSGDLNNNPVTTACGDEGETSVVNPVTPTLTTNTNIDSGTVGAILTDSATLKGATSNAGGTINFYLFAPGASCSATGTGAVYKSLNVPVHGNGTYHSSAGDKHGDNTAKVPGTYHWLAVYSGDANNTRATSGCFTEPVKIVVLPAKPPPIHPPVPVTG